jgi:hypothetical protein
LLPVCLALFLRWGVSDSCEWKGDEALHYLRAAELARGERLDHLVGFQTSAGGAHLPATFHHALALPCLVGAGPRGVCVAVSLLYALGIGALVLWGARRLGRAASFVGGLLLAVPPGLVLRSRAIRNEELLPALAVGLLLLVIEARASEDPRRAGTFAGLALALGVFMTQLHLSAGFLVIPLALLLLPTIWRAGRRPLFPGAVLLVLGASPFLLHELGGGFDETRAAIGGLLGGEVAGKGEGVHRFLPFALPARAWGFFGLWEPLRDQVGVAGLEAVQQAAPWGTLALAQAVLVAWLLAGVSAAVVSWRSPVSSVLLVATLGPWALFLGLGVEARVPYALALTPALALLAGRGAVRLAGSLPAPRVALAAATGLVVAPLCAGSAGLMRHLQAHDGAPDALYGVSYQVQRDAAAWLLTQGWRLERYEGFESVLLLDVVYRDLEPEARGGLRAQPQQVPYWELPYLLVYPFDPAATPAFLGRWEGEPTEDDTVFGPLAVRPLR